MCVMGQATGYSAWDLPNLLSSRPEICDQQDFPFGCQQVLRLEHPTFSGAPTSLSLIEEYKPKN
jgi:hypothetical protein